MDYLLVEHNLRQSFRAIEAQLLCGVVRELPGVSIASAGVAFQMFNAAFLASPVESEEELDRRVMQAAVYFGARGLEWAYWICEDLIARKPRRNMRRLLERHGLHHSVDLPGMVAERIEPAVRPLPELDVFRVADGPLRTAFCGIGSVCFHVPLVWMYEVFDNAAVWDRFAAYVGFAAGEPVATAAIVMGAGVAGVYNVATTPTRQRRGYGEAVMRFALEQARREHGIERSILQSTAQGFRLYERMGYRTVTTVSVYAS